MSLRLENREVPVPHCSTEGDSLNFGHRAAQWRFPARWRLRGTVCKSSAVNVRMSVPTASGAQGLGGNWSEFPETGPGSREEREVRSRVPGEDRTLTGGQPGLETAAGFRNTPYNI
ncbi:hypothetical protein J6590_105855 [Homalodisca vitripennis]|nr:hypothetical protein J6590_105855 [Homalodisca vitripennis]